MTDHEWQMLILVTALADVLALVIMVAKLWGPAPQLVGGWT